MKVVLDENVSGGLGKHLRDRGFSVFTVHDDFPAGSTDESVFQFVVDQRAVLVTRDYHFTNPVRFDPERTLGIVYIHHGNLTSSEEIKLVLDFLTMNTLAGFEGRLVTLYLREARIR